MIEKKHTLSFAALRRCPVGDAERVADFPASRPQAKLSGPPKCRRCLLPVRHEGEKGS